MALTTIDPFLMETRSTLDVVPTPDGSLRQEPRRAIPADDPEDARAAGSGFQRLLARRDEFEALGLVLGVIGILLLAAATIGSRSASDADASEPVALSEAVPF